MTRRAWILALIIVPGLLAFCGCATHRPAGVAAGAAGAYGSDAGPIAEAAAGRRHPRSFAVYPVEKIRPHATAQSGMYPNLFIDYPGAYHRVIGWLAFRYGFTGYLHWNVSYSYAGEGNPWDDQYRVYANGDGNLLYPGAPEYTGLAEHVAVPSLRMILFREGADDYEYLSMLAALGEAGAENADRIARSMVGSSQRWDRDADDYGNAREEIIQALLSAGRWR